MIFENLLFKTSVVDVTKVFKIPLLDFLRIQTQTHQRKIVSCRKSLRMQNAQLNRCFSISCFRPKCAEFYAESLTACIKHKWAGTSVNYTTSGGFKSRGRPWSLHISRYSLMPSAFLKTRKDFYDKNLGFIDRFALFSQKGSIFEVNDTNRFSRLAKKFRFFRQSKKSEVYESIEKFKYKWE